MLQLTKEEFDSLRFQNGTSKESRGGRRFMPYAFTEQGIAMLSSVLQSEQAVQVNIQIMRTFVKIKQWALENKEPAERLTELERYFINHCSENNEDMNKIYSAPALLMDRTKPAQIGFKTK